MNNVASVLGDIPDVIPGTFKALDDQQDVGARADMARAIHHQIPEFSQQFPVDPVHFPVLGPDFVGFGGITSAVGVHDRLKHLLHPPANL